MLEGVSMGSAVYASKAAEFSIENGVVCIKMQSGDDVACWHMPFSEFERSLKRAIKAVKLYEADAKVVRLRH
ncbi:hypothetical protein M2336_001693 [Sphingobium sp. B1D7B]|uniref:hypothetical protein n=1 Tax=Sphingobium sp. B1D7B TaxID=2940578 RepID=UPI0022256780|nr:hypothetical protein [Sphingobium sp. B1D7B]MCW2405064.1 hypothetical protein [Sphingobium sp. B1D7B]